MIPILENKVCWLIAMLILIFLPLPIHVQETKATTACAEGGYTIPCTSPIFNQPNYPLSVRNCYTTYKV